MTQVGLKEEREEKRKRAIILKIGEKRARTQNSAKSKFSDPRNLNFKHQNKTHETSN